MVLYVLFFFVFFIAALSFWGFWQATHPPKITSTFTPESFGWQFEEVSLKTKDGLDLVAWYVPTQKPTDKAIIFLHGYPADKGDLLYWAAFLKESYNLFFVDFRYFGESSGSYTSLGYHEQKDVLAAIDILKKRGIEKIGLMSFSFGASVALLTLPQTGNVDAVVADSAFANLDLMGKTYYGNIPFLQKPLMLLSKFWGRLVYGIKADEISPEAAVKNTKTPIFIIHSRQDETTLVENAYRLQKALRNNKNAQVWIYDRGVHGDIGGGDYQERILEFFTENL